MHHTSAYISNISFDIIFSRTYRVVVIHKFMYNNEMSVGLYVLHICIVESQQRILTICKNKYKPKKRTTSSLSKINCEKQWSVHHKALPRLHVKKKPSISHRYGSVFILDFILHTRSLFLSFHVRFPLIDATSKDEWAWINNYINEMQLLTHVSVQQNRLIS